MVSYFIAQIPAAPQNIQINLGCTVKDWDKPENPTHKPEKLLNCPGFSPPFKN
jgi:hypothetical protein